MVKVFYLKKLGDERKKYYFSDFVKKPERGKTEKRFWEKVNKLSFNECWIFNKKNLRRYYQLSVGGKKIYAHRFSWELHYDKIPKGFLVCHHCDNPPCVNPHHLFLGTQKANMQDCVKKGRFFKNRKKI